MKKLTNLLFGFASLFLLTSPIPENKPLKDYQKLKKDLYTKEFFECLSEANKIKYVSDMESHGVLDYWQTPEETDSLGTGDCEDWAKKLQSLASKKGIELGLWYGERNLGDSASHVCAIYSEGTQKAFIDRNKIIIKDSLENNKYIMFYFSKDMRKRNNEYKKKTGKRFFNRLI